MKTADTAVEPRVSQKRLDKVDAYILGPDEITQYWPIVSESIAIAQGMDPHDKWITQLHQNVLSGAADIWGIFGDTETDRNLFVGTLVTDIRLDHYTGNKTMVIISFQSFEVVGAKAWMDAWKILEQYAKDKGIHTIAAITKNARVVEIMNMLDFEIKTMGSKEILP